MGIVVYAHRVLSFGTEIIHVIFNVTTNPSEVIVSAELNRLSTINSLMRVENLLDVVLALGDKKVFYIDRSLPIALKRFKNDKDHKDCC